MIAVNQPTPDKKTLDSPEFVQHSSYTVKEDWVLERLKKMAIRLGQN
jgi:hypothetical protein